MTSNQHTSWRGFVRSSDNFGFAIVAGVLGAAVVVVVVVVVVVAVVVVVDVFASVIFSCSRFTSFLNFLATGADSAVSWKSVGGVSSQRGSQRVVTSASGGVRLIGGVLERFVADAARLDSEDNMAYGFFLIQDNLI